MPGQPRIIGGMRQTGRGRRRPAQQQQPLIGIMPTLTPEQQAILGGGGAMMASLFGGYGPGAGGQPALQQVEEQFGGGQIPVGGAAAGPSAYHPFAPFSPEQAGQLYQQAFGPAEERYMEVEVLPGVREAYVGPGAYWSGARAAAESRARERAGEQRASRIGQMWLAERQAARQALLPFALGLAGLETGIAYGLPGGGGSQMAGMFAGAGQRPTIGSPQYTGQPIGFGQFQQAATQGGRLGAGGTYQPGQPAAGRPTATAQPPAATQPAFVGVQGNPWLEAQMRLQAAPQWGMGAVGGVPSVEEELAALGGFGAGF